MPAKRTPAAQPAAPADPIAETAFAAAYNLSVSRRFYAEQVARIQRRLAEAPEELARAMSYGADDLPQQAGSIVSFIQNLTDTNMRLDLIIKYAADVKAAEVALNYLRPQLTAEASARVEQILSL